MDEMVYNIPDLKRFMIRTGMLRYDEEYLRLGLEPSDEGWFYKERYDELAEFCEIYPQYHLISLPGGPLYLNRSISDCWMYHLAKGDRDPGLIHDPFREEGILIGIMYY